MRFATLNQGGPDGQLLLVSQDRQWACAAPSFAPSLAHTLAHWGELAPLLAAEQAALDEGRIAAAFAFEPARCAAPLPRAPQWLDGSAYDNHARWMQRAFNLPPIATEHPLMYQGASDDFLGPCQDVPLPDEAHGIDIEGEVAVVLDEVPMGVTPDQALSHVRLLMLVNDWSLRALQPAELSTGFGFIRCKPSTAFAPLALTPDELGPHWRGGRLHRPLHASVNGRAIGRPDAGCMGDHFGRLIAHAASTRRLRAGTVIGSGTVSDPTEGAGSAALAEVRAIERVLQGEARTPFLRFGERVRLEMFDEAGISLFGAIDQRVVPGWP